MQEKRHPVKAAVWAGVALWAALALPAWGGAPGEAMSEPNEPPLFVHPTAIGDLEYRPGRGLRLGDSELTIGGYGNLTFVRDEGAEPKASASELSALVAWDPHPRLHGFAEFELDDSVIADRDVGATLDHGRFRVERAYGDLRFADAFNFRIGKFLTPVGRWNVIHAAPLVWTTSRPLTSERPFDVNTTGAELYGSFFTDPAVLTYRMFGQFVDQLQERPADVRQERSIGGRIEAALSIGPELGATYMAYRRVGGDWSHLGGIDFLWQLGPLETLAEAMFDDAENQTGNEIGGFLQLAYEVIPHWFSVGRFESFHPRSGTPVEIFTLGGAYRPFPNLIWKAEYDLADHKSRVANPGFATSLAFMF